MNPITVRVARARGLAALALVPFFLLGGARPAVAAPPRCADDRRVAVELVAELGNEDDDAAMLRYLRDRLPERLAAEGLCVDPGAPRRVAATVAWSDAAHGDYAIALRASIPEAEPFEPSAVDCPECATIEVLDTIVAQVPVALAGLAPPAPPPVVRTSAPAPSTARPPVPRPPSRDRPGLHRLGHAGIGLATAGVAGIVTGAALWARHSVVHPADPGYRLALRPAGITLVVTGAIATATGGTMIGLDLQRRRGSVAVHPALGPARAGLVLSGSF